MTPRNELDFFKMVGAGNDFVFFVGKRHIAWQRLARLVCDRHFGVGADGLVALEVLDEQTLSWEFFNSDGSPAEMCGNAARCAFSLAFQLGFIRPKARLKTVAGWVLGEICPDRSIRVSLPVKDGSFPPQNFTVHGHEGIFLNTGVPHFVISTDSLESCEAMSCAAQIRHSQEFGALGTNVTFMERIGSSSAKAVTFERGVEAFTLSCGTGALAAGVCLLGKKIREEIAIEMPGGVLFVSRQPEGEMSLRGDARVVFDGKLNPGVIDGII